jgi:transcriptional regulator with GAF, ATPase, and Fis domain
MAKKILSEKINEDLPSTKVTILQVNMFHKEYNSRMGGRLNSAKWESIRAACFPNVLNVLHKKHNPKLDHLRAEKRKNLKTLIASRAGKDPIGFKSGKENWSAKHRSREALPPEERKGKIWNGGRWLNWDTEEMDKTKNRIINALISSDNVRSKAALLMGINRDSLRKLMDKIPNIDWDADYPIVKPFSTCDRSISEDERAKMSERMKKVMAEKKSKGINPFSHLTDEELSSARKKGRDSHSAKRKKLDAGNAELIKHALSKNNNIKRRAASYLNKTDKWMRYWMNKTKYLVNWEEEYPPPCKLPK